VGAFDSGDDVGELAEVDLANDFGLAVDALGVAGVVVGVAIDEFGGKTRHVYLGHTTRFRQDP
jgi:hypothetical protein